MPRIRRSDTGMPSLCDVEAVEVSPLRCASDITIWFGAHEVVDMLRTLVSHGKPIIVESVSVRWPDPGAWIPGVR